MSLALPIIAVAGYAISNGISPVLQKIGADREVRAKSVDLTLLIRLSKNRSYMVGVLFQVGGFILSLIALQVLPLFLVQSILAASIVVTALIERYVTHHHLNFKVYLSMVVVLGGLSLMGWVAEPSHANLNSHIVKLFIEFMPIGVAGLGMAAMCLKRRVSAILLSLLAGLGYGATALAGRVINYAHPFWHVIYNPLIWSLIAYGLLAQYFFTVALQRSSGTSTNSVMILTNTLAPATLGILFFNDKIKNGLEYAIIIGSLLVVAGVIFIARHDKDLPVKLPL